jgi:hypothetical protein
MELELFRQIFEKIIQIRNFMKIRPVGAQLFHADKQTGRYDKANSSVSQFCQPT